MRLTAALIVVTCCLAGAASGFQPALQPGPATIKVTTRLVSTGSAAGLTVRTYDVLNRPAFKKPIGTAVLICLPVGSSFACREYVRLSRGQITTEGLVDGTSFYRLAVTGGTGYYDNVGGTMTVQPIGSDSQQIVVDLSAF